MEGWTPAIDQTTIPKAQSSPVSIAKNMKSHRNFIKTGRNETLQIEKLLLAKLLKSNAAINQVTTTIHESSFFSERHRFIFRAIRELSVRNVPYDSMAVVEWFTIHKLLDVVDLVDYINQIMQSLQDTSDSVSQLAEKVRDFSFLRDLIAMSSEILNLAYDPQVLSIEEVHDFAKRKFSEYFDQSNIRLS